MPRRKKPTDLKLLQGTLRKDREVEKEPEVEAASDLSPPDGLDGLALITWQDLAPKLAKARVLKETDLRALEQYCIAWRNYKEAQELINAEGFISYTSTGSPMKNPACTVQNEASRQLTSLSAQLGLDPASRTKINVGKKEKAGSFAGLQRSPARKTGA